MSKKRWMILGVLATLSGGYYGVSSLITFLSETNPDEQRLAASKTVPAAQSPEHGPSAQQAQDSKQEVVRRMADFLATPQAAPLLGKSGENHHGAQPGLQNPAAQEVAAAFTTGKGPLLLSWVRARSSGDDQVRADALEELIKDRPASLRDIGLTLARLPMSDLESRSSLRTLASELDDGSEEAVSLLRAISAQENMRAGGPPAGLRSAPEQERQPAGAAEGANSGLSPVPSDAAAPIDGQQH